jgi:hypothetical protein
VLGGTKVGEGSGDRLRSPAGPGQSPDRGTGDKAPLPRKLLDFEYLGNVSVTSLHRVQSVRTCSEYTNTRRDKEIRGVTTPDR